MYHTTGFTKAQITDLCARINATCAASGQRPWPPILGLFKSAVIALTYLRRNRVQAEIAETYDVSQSTISRAVTALTPLLGVVVAEYTPVAEDLDARHQHIVDGTLVWISDAIDGSRHDTFALKESGVLLTMDPSLWIGDKGYVGNDMLTPIKKPAHRTLLDWEKEFNTQINKVRYVIEQTIANFKTWRVLHTDYRRPLTSFRETISTVISLHFYKIACE